MKVQQKLDKVLDAVRERVQEEVGSLMGVKFVISHLFNKLTSKEEYFAEQSAKKIVAKIDVTGEIEGFGALVIGVKDAIRLGGTLIMLPQSELDEVVKNENYTEEIEDSYGEIANIIAGSYTKVFEDMFPKTCRFVRKEQVQIAPLKVDIESDEPFFDQWYYWVKSSMKIDDVEMNDLDMLIPAEQFGLEIPAGVDEPFEPDESHETPAVDSSEEMSAEPPVEEKTVEEVTQKKTVREEPVLSTKQLEKQKKLVDKILTTCSANISEEVGALLGVEIKLGKPTNTFVNKEDFFQEEVSGKQVLAHMKVADETEGQSFLFMSLKDAIRVGSVLIMLPPTELETAVNEEEFSADTEDAYGEIANIISGVYTQVFQEQFSKNIRFIKTDLEIVSPMKVETETDEVIPNQYYYLSSSSLEIGDKQCGQVCMLFPVDILKLQDLAHSEDSGESDSLSAQMEENGDSLVSEISEPVHPSAPATKKVDAAVEVLLVQNDATEAEKILSEMKKIGISAKSISFSDSISSHITPELRLIFIVMQEVDEQAYGVTIKVNTQSGAPIVAAGPEWTRSKVIKAVKYGVQDILVTPAERDDIMEKVNSNIIKLAA